MNWLAHFVLSPDDDRVRMGNWLPDVLEREALASIQDPMIRQGIELHQYIDEFTDRHPVVRSARERLQPGVRRFAGIVLDVYWDHFLTVKFETLVEERLEDFVWRVNAGLYARSDFLAQEIRDVLSRMDSESWLKSYGTMEGVELTFRRISRRLSPRACGLFRPAEARRFLEQDYQWFQVGFDGFWNDLEQATLKQPQYGPAV